MRKLGYLEVITGPMYCGKTEELIRQVKRAAIGKKHVVVCKHAIDTRYGKDHNVHSHSGIMYKSIVIHTASEILDHVNKTTDIIAIDEAQWLGNDLIQIVKKLLNRNKHIIIAGLALTFDQQPFDPIPNLMAFADKVTKLSAVCTKCGADAVFHKRVVRTKPIDALSIDPLLVSKLQDNEYEARCRNCFKKK